MSIHMCTITTVIHLLLLTLTVAGRKDLSLARRGCSNLSLKEMLSAVRATCMRLEVFSRRDDSLTTILLSLTTSTWSGGCPTTELAFLIILFSFQFLTVPSRDTAAPEDHTQKKIPPQSHRASGAPLALHKTQLSVADTASSVLS